MKICQNHLDKNSEFWTFLIRPPEGLSGVLVESYETTTARPGEQILAMGL